MEAGLRIRERTDQMGHLALCPSPGTARECLIASPREPWCRRADTSEALRRRQRASETDAGDPFGEAFAHGGAEIRIAKTDEGATPSYPRHRLARQIVAPLTGREPSTRAVLEGVITSHPPPTGHLLSKRAECDASEKQEAPDGATRAFACVRSARSDESRLPVPPESARNGGWSHSRLAERPTRWSSRPQPS